MTNGAKKSQKGRGGVGVSLHKQELFKKFIDFYAMPDPDKCAEFDIPFDEKKGKYERVPTQIDFAKKYGLARETLSRWKNRIDFIPAVERQQKGWGLEKIPNVMAALYRRCLRFGISSDVELYLAYYANWDRKQVIKLTGEKYDLDDLRSLVALLPEDRQKAFYATISNIIRETEIYGQRAEVSEYGPAQSGSDPQNVRGYAHTALALPGADDKVSEEAS